MTRARGSIAGLMLCALAAACGGTHVEGRYTGRGESLFDSLTFRSDGKVEIVFVGARHEGGYVVDGGNVTITAPNGVKSALTIDANGCLGHQLLGTYCRDGNAPPASASAGAAAGALGEVYEGSAREGRITLEFSAARKVRLTMTPTGGANAPERMSFDVGYVVHGDEITVSLPGNSENLMLTRAGTDLEGTLNGETVRFVKR